VGNEARSGGCAETRQALSGSEEMTMYTGGKFAGAAVLVLVWCASALAAAPPEEDRQAILSMVGAFKVNFHFKETATFDGGGARTPSEGHQTEAHEKVFLVADNGDYISLQHILVIDMGEEKGVVKHWRQDWQFQPKHVDVYIGHGTWERQPVPRRAAKGAWAQTVYQVDDGPRYGGYGVWRHIGAYSFWESNESYRPLPRRETEQHQFYDVLVGRNRQSITPTGWLHEQDNYKLDLDLAGNRVLARETGFDTYDRVTDYDFTVADEYWEATKDLWALVRANWEHEFKTRKSLHLHNDGRGVYRKVLGMADEFRAGALGTKEEAFDAMRAKITEALDRPVNDEVADEPETE